MTGKKRKRKKYPRHIAHIREVKRRKDKERRDQIKYALWEKRYLLMILTTILLLAVLIPGGIGIVRAVGKNRLQSGADSKKPQLQQVVQETAPEPEFTETEQWEEGWILINDTVYRYNDDILTFLVMGIDKNSDVKEVAEGTDGGQADALFLAVMNPREKTIKIVGINRNTMTDIDMYDENGDYVTTVTAQIAVQHGFGNGLEKSCEYQQKAVERLFYNLPIHGYAAVNMSAIATINDAVGGIDVTVLDDISKKDASLVKGNTVHLMGESAFWYVKYRDTSIFGSADMRLERQKQYLKAFIEAAKQAVKSDIGVVLDLYQAIRTKMVTDISLDEAVYLAPMLPEYRFDENSFYSLKGETVMGERFEEFYPDEEALREMILEIFYEKVEKSEKE